MVGGCREGRGSGPSDAAPSSGGGGNRGGGGAKERGLALFDGG